MLLPSAIAAISGAPFADAIFADPGAGRGILVAVIAAISAFGTGNSLLLFAAESSPHSWRSAAILPPVFARDQRGWVRRSALC